MQLLDPNTRSRELGRRRTWSSSSESRAAAAANGAVAVSDNLAGGSIAGVNSALRERLVKRQSAHVSTVSTVASDSVRGPRMGMTMLPSMRGGLLRSRRPGASDTLDGSKLQQGVSVTTPVKQLHTEDRGGLKAETGDYPEWFSKWSITPSSGLQ